MEAQAQSEAISQTPNQSDNKVIENLKKSSTWMRILYMILFVFAYIIVEFILTGVIIAQILFNLFTGQANERLRAFGQDLSKYVYDILTFMTYSSEDKPFPFSDWKKSS